MRAALLLLGGMMLALVLWTLNGCPVPPTSSPKESSPSSPASFSTLHALDENTLIDLRDFEFYTRVSCNSSSPPFVVAIVHSAPKNTFNRRMIRSTWGKDILLFFMLGQTNSSEIQSEIDREIQVHGDIVQGSFMDTYRNLTYKHVMGLKWATYFCPSARYILKTDDDVFVNTPFLHQYLQAKESLESRGLILCQVARKSLVSRSYRSKWRVSPREYPGRVYPDFCLGWAILYSSDAAFILYVEAQRTPFFWIDDVHITGTIREKSNLTNTHLEGLVLKEEQTLQFVLSESPSSTFLFGMSPPERLPELWEIVTSIG